LDFTQHLGIWAYLLLALLVMVEGPVATLAGAVAASTGLMKPIWVFTAASAGNLLADLLWYTLGYLGKMEWVHRYGAYVGVRGGLVQRMHDDIQRHSAKVLLVAKLTLGFTIPTLIATGLARVPMRRWFGMLLLGETIWTGLLVFLGVRFGRYLQTLEQGLEIVALIGALLFAGLLIFYIAHLRKRSASAQAAEAAAAIAREEYDENLAASDDTF
jgi:membrane protein DedA with SNARE-associated domain